MLSTLFSLLLWIEPAAHVGKAPVTAPARAAPGGWQWTNMHTYLTVGIVLVLLLIAAVLIGCFLIWMFKKPGGTKTRYQEIGARSQKPEVVTATPIEEIMPETSSSSVAARALLRARAMDAVERWETELDRAKLDAAQLVETQFIQKAAAQLQIPAPFGPAGKPAA